ncbi:DUF6197 family protein [Brevundimonas diminuta]|uniref:DUF6197 family protein n=1 Tax=Brevundimonas diminuta TaxID=293 RepID=UPI003F810F89
MPESTKSPAEVLEAAADLLEQPGAWTQDEFARDSVGRVVCPTSTLATCWCVRGAIAAVNEDEDDHTANNRNWKAAARLLGFHDAMDIELWNDAPERTQAEVVAALREAARQARGGEA